MTAGNLNQLLTFAAYGFLVAAIVAPLLIKVLYQFNLITEHKLLKNKVNEVFFKMHSHKSGTPRTGGLIISIPLFLICLVALPASNTKLIFLFGILFFTIYGLIDDMIVSGRKLSDKFRAMVDSAAWRVAKLVILYALIAVLLFLLVELSGITSINLWQNATVFQGLGLADVTITLKYAEPIHLFENISYLARFNWMMSVNYFAIAFLAFCGLVAMYAIEITDGVDGLVAGQFLINYLVYGVVIMVTGRFELLPIIGVLVGVTLVYLYFNINPARVFMGGTGTFPVAFSLLMFALITNTISVFLIMGILFWAELISSFSQMIAIRFFDRKLFKIAPLHHHLEAIGWPESKVVQRLWLFGIVAGLLALWWFSGLPVVSATQLVGA